MVNENREGYKNAELGWIPEDWKIKTLEEVCIPKGLVRGPFGGALKKSCFIDKGYKVYEQKNAIQGDENIGEYFVDDNKYEELKRFAINENDFIVSCSGTIGKIFKIPKGAPKGVINQALLKITINPKCIDHQYFTHFFTWNKFQNIIIDSTQGGAMKNLIGMDKFKGTNILIPEIQEQEKIAAILDTLDMSITNISNKIEDLTQLKKALSKKLLTEGIGHTEFKDSEVGRIPVEWEVKRIEEIADVKGGKRLPKGNSLVDENTGFPYIRVADMYMGGIRLDDIKYVPLGIAESIKRYKISKDDLFISVAGTIGIVGEVPDELDNANLTENANKLCNIKCDKAYLSYYLRSGYFTNLIDSVKTASAQPKIALTRIVKFLVALPTLNEQIEIAKRLKALDTLIIQYQAQKSDYNKLKQGLMQQLLTGKVRVKI